MRRHDAYVALIRSTVVVVAIGFAWSSFVLADEPTSPPAPPDQSVQEQAVPPVLEEEKTPPPEAGDVQERAVPRITGPTTGTMATPDQLAGSAGTPVQAGNPTLRWDTRNPPATRFTMAFQGAVLDKNTGLVWEQAPELTRFDWYGAVLHCVQRTVGGTRGWRLPSVVEVQSVSDPSLRMPFVPGIFAAVGTMSYWSATTRADVPTEAWWVAFQNNLKVFSELKRGSSFLNAAWCVRGGMNADAY